MKPSVKTAINFLIKGALLLLLGFILYKQLTKDGQSISESYQSLVASIKTVNIWYLVLVLCMMPINWIIESKRFQLLMSKFVVIDFATSLRSILSGLSFASVTPNRIGEYGGRVLALEAEDNKYGLLATFAGSIAQNLVNLILGLLGGLYFLNKYMEVADDQLLLMTLLVVLFCVAISVLYYRLDLLSRIFKLLPFIPKISKVQRALDETKNLGSVILTKVLSYSFLRYAVYSSQYVLILYAFDFNIPIISAYSGVAFIYLVQSGLPIPPLFGLLARGEIAILIWGTFVDSELVILTATLLLWIINLILPSFIGLFIVYNIDIIKSLGYGKNTDLDDSSTV